MNIDKSWFIAKIQNFLKNDESNKMNLVDGSLIFNPDIIVGFVSGNDPIFKEYKEIIGSFHLTPVEAFSKFCEKNKFSYSIENLSVVAFVLPINNKTKKQNFNYSKNMPSPRWAHTRLFGEQSNQKLQKYLVSELEKNGIKAVAPIMEEYLFKINKEIWASTWSHRHMLFAAGLGSFGLSDGFINEKGKAMRCGSIVIDHKLPSDAYKRPTKPYEYCIDCGDCVKRCPVGAITFEKRHNKHICHKHVSSTVPYINNNYGIDIYGCGLCQVGVSCENIIPNKRID
jgi:ferredoxin